MAGKFILDISICLRLRVEAGAFQGLERADKWHNSALNGDARGTLWLPSCSYHQEQVVVGEHHPTSLTHLGSLCS